MTRDVNILRTVLMIALTIAAVGATAVPLVYAFLPWRSRIIGRAFMLQAVVLAVALDASLLISLWRPKEILIYFWVQAMIFIGIAISTSALAWITLRMRFPKKRRFRMLFNPGVYNVLKWFVTIVLPGLSTLYFGLAQLWSLPHAANVAGTIALITFFLGACLGVSTKTYNNTEAKYDGLVVIQPGEDGSTLKLQSISTSALETKGELLLKVDNRVSNP